MALTTNSYGYDADGNRILLAQGGNVLTNAVSAGYQITAIKNSANGSTVESYAFDQGGRETSIARNGTTLNFGYNSSDQVIAVTNATANTWVTYVHDAEGRRTESADSSGIVRRFLVAPVPGSDLESPTLIANSSGTLQAGYVYDGDEPVLCYNGSGTANYYLEDGMGSVVGIAPASSPSTANTTRLFYDGFGNSRLTNGPAPAMPTGVGGDFRFHGAWLEADVNCADVNGRTPLFSALLNGPPIPGWRRKGLRLLKKFGVLITPPAKEEDVKEVVKLLINYGADVNRVDEVGRSPLSYATTPGLARMLIDAGAKLKVRDHENHDAAYWLKKKGIRDY